MLIIASFCLMLWVLSLGITLIGTYLALKNFLSCPVVPSQLLPISILKPLKGIEEGLWENLLSFIDLDYPDYELILCLDSEQDPAFPIARKFVEEHSNKKLSLSCQKSVIGPNPKVNNISVAFERAKNDLILISDSNIRATKLYLKNMVSAMGEGVGIVTSVVVGKGSKNLGGDLESIFLNTFYARWMWFCKKVGSPAVVGKSMLFSKRESERFGGMKTLSLYIAEDYMAGQAFEKIGKKIGICHEPVVQWIGNYPIKSFWKRHTRWGRIRRAQAPIVSLFEPVFFSTVSGFLGTVGVRYFYPEWQWVFLSFHFIIWAFSDFLLLWAEKALNFRIFFSWILREILAVPLFLHTCMSTEVNWRGNPLKIKRGGLAINP